MKDVSHRADSLYRDYKIKPKAVVVIGEAGWIVYRSTLPESLERNTNCTNIGQKIYYFSRESYFREREFNSKMLIPYKEATKGFNVTGCFSSCPHKTDNTIDEEANA